MEFDKAYTISNGQKLIAMTENGPLQISKPVSREARPGRSSCRGTTSRKLTTTRICRPSTATLA
jgi:hypothetical protein